MSRNCGCELCTSNRSTLGPTGENAHVEGFLTVAKGFASHAEGAGVCDINATLSDVAGEPMRDMSGRTGAVFNSACADGAHVENYGCVATGLYSHAHGVGSQAKGDASTAFGLNTKSAGKYSHSMGRQCLAEGDSSHARGLETFAKGKYSDATGCFTCALGDHSYTAGIDSIARNLGQRAYSNGKFECKGDNQCSRFIVRNELPPGCHDRLYLDGDFEQITVPCNSTWKVDVTLITKSVEGNEGWCCFDMRYVIEINSHGHPEKTPIKPDEKDCRDGTSVEIEAELGFVYDPDLDEHILYVKVWNDTDDTIRFFGHVITYELSVSQKKCDKKCGCLRQMQKPCNACC